MDRDRLLLSVDAVRGRLFVALAQEDPLDPGDGETLVRELAELQPRLAAALKGKEGAWAPKDLADDLATFGAVLARHRAEPEIPFVEWGIFGEHLLRSLLWCSYYLQGKEN